MFASTRPATAARAARPTALPMPAAMTTTATAAARWHKHPAARQRRQQRRNNSYLDQVIQLHHYTLLLDEINFSPGMTVQNRWRHGYRVTPW